MFNEGIRGHEGYIADPPTNFVLVCLCKIQPLILLHDSALEISRFRHCRIPCRIAKTRIFIFIRLILFFFANNALVENPELFQDDDRDIGDLQNL